VTRSKYSVRLSSRTLILQTGPVAGFRVDDRVSARTELEEAGAELIGALTHGECRRPLIGTIHREVDSAWQHFRGPDGNVYEVNQHVVQRQSD
jgi:hypothetical protein